MDVDQRRTGATVGVSNVCFFGGTAARRGLLAVFPFPIDA